MTEPLTPPDSLPYEIPPYVCPKCGNENCEADKYEGTGRWIVCPSCDYQAWDYEFEEHLEKYNRL